MSVGSGNNEMGSAVAPWSIGGDDAPVLIAEAALIETIPSVDRITLRRIERSELGAIRVEFGFAVTPFGECLIATRENLICHLTFHDAGERESEMERLGQYWPRLANSLNNERAQSLVSGLFSPTSPAPELVLAGTQFQHQVWQALQRIPYGSVTTYGAIARTIGAPSASRAVGAAVGANRIAWLIPCHRVVPQNRQLGGFRWGIWRKRAMLSREQAICNQG